MVEEIYNILSSISEDIPVRYGWYDETIVSTHITYFVLLEVPTLFEDDDSVSLEYTIQVDTWSMGDDTEVKDNIKMLMKQAGYSFLDSKDQFEVQTKIYHKALRFTIIKEEN